MSDKIDYTSLKVFMPDSANKETTNRFTSGDASSYTVTQRGFAMFFINAFTTNPVTVKTSVRVSLQVNGKTVSIAGSEGINTTNQVFSSVGGTIPVKPGDILTWRHVGTQNNVEVPNLTTAGYCECYFIPGVWV